MTIRFFVPGIPQPGGSKKAFVVKGRAVVVEDAKRNKPWRDRVASTALEAYSGPPLDVPLIVTMAFVVARPAGHFGTGRNRGLVRDSAPGWPAVRPDVLKLARSTEDALSGVLWRDDSQTVELRLTKHYGDRPGVEITVEPLVAAKTAERTSELALA